MKKPLSSISYKQYKQLIESGQHLNLTSVVNFVGIGGSSLVTGPVNYLHNNLQLQSLYIDPWIDNFMYATINEF